MWKNQIFYEPLDFGQYTGPDGKIYSVMDEWSLDQYKNETVYSYDWRMNNIDPTTNQTYITADFRSNSRFRYKPMSIRGLAFIPSILVLVMFGVLIYIFGREGTAQFEKKKGKRGASERITGVRISQIDPESTDGGHVEFQNEEEETPSKGKDEDNEINKEGKSNYGSTQTSPVQNSDRVYKPVQV